MPLSPGTPDHSLFTVRSVGYVGRMANNSSTKPDVTEYPCYGGQWTVHAPHPYTVERAAWRGGGKRTVQCPGKTAATVLGRN